MARIVGQGGGKIIMTPRGLRNNNPLNIEKSSICGIKHTGEIPGKDPRFATYDTMTNGIRAGFSDILHKILHDKCDTVWEIVTKWAPKNENNTTAYVAAVCKRTSYLAMQPIEPTFNMVAPLIRAMAFQECGEQADTMISPEVYKAAWAALGIEGIYRKYGYVPK